MTNYYLELSWFYRKNFHHLVENLLFGHLFVFFANHFLSFSSSLSFLCFTGSFLKFSLHYLILIFSLSMKSLDFVSILPFEAYISPRISAFSRASLNMDMQNISLELLTGSYRTPIMENVLKSNILNDLICVLLYHFRVIWELKSIVIFSVGEKKLKWL